MFGKENILSDVIAYFTTSRTTPQQCVFPAVVWRTPLKPQERKDSFIVPEILLHAHPASFAHNFVSGMQSFYFSESQDARV